jgi:hypothetical protein
VDVGRQLTLYDRFHDSVGTIGTELFSIPSYALFCKCSNSGNQQRVHLGRLEPAYFPYAIFLYLGGYELDHERQRSSRLLEWEIDKLLMTSIPSQFTGACARAMNSLVE